MKTLQEAMMNLWYVSGHNIWINWIIRKESETIHLIYQQFVLYSGFFFHFDNVLNNSPTCSETGNTVFYVHLFYIFMLPMGNINQNDIGDKIKNKWNVSNATTKTIVVAKLE